MPKKLYDVKLNVSGIGKMSDRILLSNSENLSIAFTKINTYLNDLKSGAFTDAYTHPTYTPKSSGLYKITVNELGHVSDATAVTGSDLPSHTHDYIPLSGSDNITGNLKINSAGKGVCLKDKNSNLYPGIIDNGTNLWIGSGATASTHHVGSTYISAGYNSTSGAGNSTIFISVPNATNDDATNYKVLHNGNTSFTPSQTSGNKVGTLVINDVSNDIYANDNTVLQSNSTTGNFRPIVLGTTNNSDSTQLTTTTTGQAYVTDGVFVKPSGGVIYANDFYTTNRIRTGYGAALRTNGLNLRIYYKDSSDTTYDYNRTCIRAINGGVTDSASLGLIVDSGGLTVIGGGESAANLASLIDADQSVTGAAKLNVSGAGNFTSFDNSSEQLILSSDNDIYFVTKCNTIANRRAVELSSALEFHPDDTNTGSIGTSIYRWGSAYISTINGNLNGNVSHVIKNPTTETWYGLTFHDNRGTAGVKELGTNDAVGVAIIHTTSGGRSIIIAGNETTAGSGGKSGGFRAYTTGTSYAELRGDTSSNSTGLAFKTSTNNDGDYIAPYTTNKYDMGTSLYRWRNVYAITLNGALDPSNLSDAVSVSKGGTGQTTLTSNAIIAGNGTSDVKMITTASGALYATAANGAAQFGTLPVAQGGTGATSASNARTNLGLGTAATKDSTTSVTSGGTDLITSGGVYTAIGLDTSVSLTSSVGTVSKQAYYSAATKICTFVLQLKLTSAISASSSTTTIATIGKNPTYVCPVVAIDGSNNGLVARVDNSGNIQLCKNAAISSGSTIRVSGSFPVA